MFAFFVWDARQQRGFAARDPLGVKPFAYRWSDGELAFASEAQALAHTVPRAARPRHAAILEYLVAPFFSGVEAPVFEGLEYLQPGHCLEIDARGLRLHRYFRYRVAREAGERPEPDALRQAFTRAVRRCARADAPLGTFLSGGLDSTAIAAVAGPALPAFTVAFEGMERYDYSRSLIVGSDDRPLAEHAARELRLALQPVEIPRRDLAADLERVACTNDALPAWEQEIAQDRLARAAAAQVKGVLVGDAADETHFGYHFLLDGAATASPRAILERFGPAPIRRDVLADPLDHFDRRYRAWVPPGGDPPERTAGTAELVVERWLPRLLHNGDVHAMRSSLEARVPFADRELLALAQGVPPGVALAGGVEKAHLRDALRGLVPEAVRVRRKSALPKDQAAEPTYRREAARLLREPPALLRELVDLARIERRLASPEPLSESERAVLFRLICLTHFCRHHGFA